MCTPPPTDFFCASHPALLPLAVTMGSHGLNSLRGSAGRSPPPAASHTQPDAPGPCLRTQAGRTALSAGAFHFLAGSSGAGALCGRAQSPLDRKLTLFLWGRQL